MTMQDYLKTLEPGSDVMVLDTSNDRERTATVRRLFGPRSRRHGVEVYVHRFQTLMTMNKDGMTSMGRFRLLTTG